MIVMALAMAGLGAVEAVVHLWRYRSAARASALSSALSSGAVQTIRVLGIGGIAAGLDHGHVLLPAAAYIVSPVLVTYALHAWLVRREGGVA